MKVRAFCALLEDSDLLDPDFREQFSRRADACAAGDDAAPLAQWLVEKGWLTPWQAQQLLDGFSTFRLGRYVLLEALGQGGMGAVYKACHPAMGRTVAVKILSDARLSNPRAVARFQREMQAAARLDHPNIISAHDAGLIGDQHFLVMEYAEGQDLNAWQKHYGKIPVVWACEFIRQAAMGLQHAHEQGMVHRDIKPANLLVIWSDPDSLPVLKILDLGLARLIAEAQPDDNDSNFPQPPMEGTVTQDGAIVGTPDYLSPEQIEGRAVDVRSDLFSLGCTFFKILTGQIPFGGKSLMDKIHNRTSRSAPPAMALRSLLPEAPPEVEAIVKKLLERDPAKRYQTPQEVAAALAPYTLRALRAERRKKAARKPAADASSAAAAGSTTVAQVGGAGAPVGGVAGNSSASTVSATDFAAPNGASAGYSSISAVPVITPLPPAVWAASGASSGTQPTLGGSNDTPSSNGVRPVQPSSHAPPAVWPEGPPRLPEPGVDWRGMPQMSALEADAASGDDHSREFLRLLARQNGQVQDLPLDGFVPPPPFKAPSDPLEALSVRPSPVDMDPPPPLKAGPPPSSAPLVSPPPQPRWSRDGEKSPPLDVSDSFAPPPPGGLWAPPEPHRAVEANRAVEPGRAAEPGDKSVAPKANAVNGAAPTGSAPTAPAALPNQVVQPGRPVALPYPPPSSSSIRQHGAGGRGVPSPRSGLGNGAHHGAGHNGVQATTYASAIPQAASPNRGPYPPMGGMPLVPQGPLVAGSPAWGGVSAGPPSSSLSSVLPNPAFPFGEPGKGGGGTRYSRLREAAQRRRWWQRNGAAVAFLTAIAVLAIACCALMAFSQGPR